jgi:hypothetical protein
MQNTSTQRKRLPWHGLMFVIYCMNNKDFLYWYAACSFSRLACCFFLHVIFSHVDSFPLVRWGWHAILSWCWLISSYRSQWPPAAEGLIMRIDSLDSSAALIGESSDGFITKGY